jgi:hypothetical protein
MVIILFLFAIVYLSSIIPIILLLTICRLSVFLPTVYRLSFVLSKSMQQYHREINALQIMNKARLCQPSVTGNYIVIAYENAFTAIKLMQFLQFQAILTLCFYAI